MIIQRPSFLQFSFHYGQGKFINKTTDLLLLWINCSHANRLFVEFWKRHQSALQYDWVSRINRYTNICRHFSNSIRCVGFHQLWRTFRTDSTRFWSKSKQDWRRKSKSSYWGTDYLKKSRVFTRSFSMSIQIKEPYMSPSKRIPFFLIASGVVLAMVSESTCDCPRIESSVSSYLFCLDGNRLCYCIRYHSLSGSHGRLTQTEQCECLFFNNYYCNQCNYQSHLLDHSFPVLLLDCKKTN